MKTILVVAALDAKGLEIRFCKKRIEELGAKALLMDGGLGEPTITPDITREEVAKAAGLTIKDVRKIPAEAEALGIQAKGASNIAQRLAKEGKIHGVLGIGSNMGTSLETGVMRSLPIGIPKFMVSSQAGNPAVVGPLIGTKDICMFHSVTDVVGINTLTRTIFSRACGGVVGMANAEVKQETDEKKIVALMAKGTTEPINRLLRYRIEASGFQPMTFHCFGYGPASLEQVIADGYINGGVIELSSDWLDYICGGDSFPPGDRYETAGKQGLPQVFVPGSCDFIAASPGTYPGRKVAPHNKAVALFRSSREELVRVGKEVGQKLSKSKGPVTVVIPMRGFSMHDQEGEALWEPDANTGFVEGISAFGDKIKIVKVDAHIFDPEFIDAVMDAFLKNVTKA